MTQDQVLAQLRQILPAIGWLLIARGYVTAETWSAFIAVGTPAMGAVLVLGSAAWSWIANSKASIVKSVAAMPETKVVPGANGTATVVIHDENLAQAAKEAATPLANGKN